jgi:hypothetical protein
MDRDAQEHDQVQEALQSVLAMGEDEESDYEETKTI